MSFFRNLRTSITRGRSSSRDTTPVRNSKSGSVISSFNSGNGNNNSKRRDSTESRNDSLLNRSDTFVLDESDVTPSHSNCSTLEKKSKKSKVLEKFSTFTKRKKTPATLEGAAFEHHPSDNATNTYYKWQPDGGGNSLDYDSQNDPFNFLYEHQHSLKSLQHNGHNFAKSDNTKSTTSSTKVFDSSTYRKSKMPSDLKKQLQSLKDQELINKENKDTKNDKKLMEEEGKKETDDPLSCKETDKYKTVTLNSFRKSFREKFLQQQKEAAYNPAWFVEVDPLELKKNTRDRRESSKENRRDLLVFENDNYRPGSRSPVRDLSNRKPLRSPTRSPIKRSETFKVEPISRIDNLNEQKVENNNNTSSIRIEFKNSITPHVPGRMVPLGVAKPIPVQYYSKTDPQMNTSYTIKTAGNTTTTTRINNNSPVYSNWNKIQSPVRGHTATDTPRLARYQTLVQIKNDKGDQQASPVTQRNSRLSTRIQLGSGSTDLNQKSPCFGKRYNSSHLLSTSSNKTPQTFKQTYFGDSPQVARVTHSTTSLNSPAADFRVQSPRSSASGTYKYHASSLHGSASTLTPSVSSSIRITPSYSTHNSNNSSHNNLARPKHQSYHCQTQQQHKSRIGVAAQRRSRSPIKIPWR